MSIPLSRQPLASRHPTSRGIGLVLAAVCLVPLPAPTQQPARTPDQEAAYTRTLTQRADRIVAGLGLTDPNKATRVRELIVRQYRALSAVHDALDAQVKVAGTARGDSQEATQAAITAARQQARAKLDALHAEYLASLAAELSPEQVDRVKDGMTYGIAQVTYDAYLKMLPDLTDAQKRQIRAWLLEARELAMDEGSAEAKHRVFGRYKGKINNYLSAAGYDLKQAERNLRTSQPPAPAAKTP